MQRRNFLAGAVVGATLFARPAWAEGTVPIVGLPCEGCEAVFDGLPDAIGPHARLAPRGEPGEPMHLHGVVRDRHAMPRAGVIVYAYQTDRDGVYPRLDTGVGEAAARHGRLRAWACSDADGRFAFASIRPGHYPARGTPQHVHLHVIEPGCATYYIDDVLFRDDPVFVATDGRVGHAERGGSGVASPAWREGAWQVRRDIVLGRNVPGAGRCT